MIKFDIGDIVLYKTEVTLANLFKKKNDGKRHLGYSMSQYLINFMTKSPYTHVGIVLETGVKEVVIGQALDHFNINNEYFYMQTLEKEKRIHVLRVPKLTDAQKMGIRAEGYGMEGFDYDWKGIILIGVYLLTGKTLFKDNAKKYFCSEAVDQILRIVGVKLFKKASRNVSPADFDKCTLLKDVF